MSRIHYYVAMFSEYLIPGRDSNKRWVGPDFFGLGLKLFGFGLGFLGLLKFKIGLKAFKSWALITGLKKIIKFYYISLLKFWGGPFGPEWLIFKAHWALPNFQARWARAWGLI
jgi:hypothetical protein